MLQSIAASRLEANASVYGCVGPDSFGDMIIATLGRAGIDTGGVERASDTPTGASLVLMDSGRGHLAAHASGANAKLDGHFIERHLPRIRGADAVLLDLAIPAAAVRTLLAAVPPPCPIVASRPGGVDAGLPWERVDFLITGRDELPRIGSSSTGSDDAALVGKIFLDRGVRSGVVVVGADGAYLVEKGGVTRFPAHGQPAANPSPTVDAFSAALATRLAAGKGLYEAVGFASAAASISASRSGGPGSLPTHTEVLANLSRFTPHPSRLTG